MRLPLVPACHVALLGALAPILSACAAGDPAKIASPTSHLAAYTSEAELHGALERWRLAAQQRQAERRRESLAGAMLAAPPPPPSALAQAAPSARAATPSVAGAEADSITNVQTAGVDEGGIVKRAGDHLVILRRGRLFTVRVGGDALAPVAAVDAFAPGSDPRGAWYDELLISGNTVVVVGFSYARGGTEIGLFELRANGVLQHRATHHLRSFDYYSARNYASRLVGRKLVFYSPTMLSPWGPPLAQSMPALRRHGAVPAEFERILPATRIHRTDDEFDSGAPLALHTVTQCEIGDIASAGALRCEASAVLGPPGRVFYVSQGSVYVWTHQGSRRGGPGAPRPDGVAPASAIFRLPLDGSAPSALKTAGVPTDPLSFLEDTSGHLNVLVRDSGVGDVMWAAEGGRSQVALLRLPLRALGDGRGAAQREHYRRLPDVPGGAFHNRFVGDWLVWGAADSAWALRYAADVRRGSRPVPLALTHRVERIEALGPHALLVGNSGSELGFTAVRLDESASLADRHAVPGARQGESRTHGFFYRPLDESEGILGLPVLGPGAAMRPVGPAVYTGPAGPASVVFLRQRDLRFSAAGDLQASRETPREDGCRASCVDWYGNARPIFLGDRVLALMGYEIVEGRLPGRGSDAGITERRRVNFSPRGPVRDGRPTPFD